MLLSPSLRLLRRNQDLHRCSVALSLDSFVSRDESFLVCTWLYIRRSACVDRGVCALQVPECIRGTLIFVMNTDRDREKCIHEVLRLDNRRLFVFFLLVSSCLAGPYTAFFFLSLLLF